MLKPSPPFPSAHDHTTLNPRVTKQLDGDDWELGENDLPEGSILPGSKSLFEDPPESNTYSKKYKKPKTSKGAKCGNKRRKHESRTKTNVIR
jgi:hypothetical protein